MYNTKTLGRFSQTVRLPAGSSSREVLSKISHKLYELKRKY